MRTSKGRESAYEGAQKMLRKILSRIERERPRTLLVHECYDCNGSGADRHSGPAWSHLLCPTCRGQGLIVVTD